MTIFVITTHDHCTCAINTSFICTEFPPKLSKRRLSLSRVFFILRYNHLKITMRAARRIQQRQNFRKGLDNDEVSKKRQEFSSALRKANRMEMAMKRRNFTVEVAFSFLVAFALHLSISLSFLCSLLFAILFLRFALLFLPPLVLKFCDFRMWIASHSNPKMC